MLLNMVQHQPHSSLASLSVSPLHGSWVNSPSLLRSSPPRFEPRATASVSSAGPLVAVSRYLPPPFGFKDLERRHSISSVPSTLPTFHCCTVSFPKPAT